MGIFSFLKKKSVATTSTEPVKRGDFASASSSVQKNEQSVGGNMNEEQMSNIPVPEEFLKDITFIREMRHSTADPWHQYDILLAARGYGWNMMIEWADYMAGADLERISEVTCGSFGIQEERITESYLKNGGKCSQTPELESERGMLSIAGLSNTLKVPMKIAWVNQTRTLRLFTLLNNEELIVRYVETMVRRTFGTADAMKLGRPIPVEQ